MISRTLHTIITVRVVLLIAVLALGLVAGLQTASADVLNPARDTGGPGGSGGVAAGGYEVLAGSGYEQVTVAEVDQPTASGMLDEAARSSSLIAMAPASQTTADASSQESALAGSGYEQASGTTDEALATHGMHAR